MNNSFLLDVNNISTNYLNKYDILVDDHLKYKPLIKLISKNQINIEPINLVNIKLFADSANSASYKFSWQYQLVNQTTSK